MKIWIIFFVSLLGIALPFVIYPSVLLLIGNKRKKITIEKTTDVDLPPLSIVVAVRNGELLIEQKIINSLQLDYPENSLEVIVVSDGSTDATEQILRELESNRVKIFLLDEHRGKQEALNLAVSHCKGDILLFTDADAMLDARAAKLLVKHFIDKNVGGVVGQRRILDKNGKMKTAQKNYIQIDSLIKALESNYGSTTSNDGKIYAIRRRLFLGVEKAVTDDLYVCMSILRQGYMFKYEPDAIAKIATPSRNSKHEISRRRRIVGRSLYGIWISRNVFNPNRTSYQISFGLFISKVIRRLLPLFLILLMTSISVLSISQPHMHALFLILTSAVSIGALHPIINYLYQNNLVANSLLITKISSLSFYFLIGNMGTLLGVFDFLVGQRTTKWNPYKSG